VIDLVIRNGLVVTPEQEAVLDVGIEGETIAFVAEPGSIETDAPELDAAGLLVLPGGIEPHAHIHEPMHRGWTHGEEVWLQPPEGASRAALHGGTTTVISFAFMDVHVTDVEFDCNLAVAHRREVFEGRSYADFAFHPVLTGTPTEATLATVGEAAQDGTATFKYFTTDLTTTQRGIRLDNGSIRALLEQCARHGAVAMVHAEDDDLIKYMETKLRRDGRTELRNVHLVHTNAGEELAVRASGLLARDSGAALYVAHVCSARARDAIAEMREAGQPVFGEALHNCMCFSLERYDEPDGARYHIGMGLRPKDDCAALWEGLVDGRLSTLATDEYTTSYAVKMAGTDIESTPGGHVGIETRGIIGYSEGVASGRMSLRRFVDVWATNPARITGLYPQKGVLAPGSDADVVLWDPKARWAITMDDLHHDGDYSPWEGWEVTGRPVTTILRGAVVVDRGRLLAGSPGGRFAKRRACADVLAGPVV
jgi:dihydropyrimidinase